MDYQTYCERMKASPTSIIIIVSIPLVYLPFTIFAMLSSKLDPVFITLTVLNILLIVIACLIVKKYCFPKPNQRIFGINSLQLYEGTFGIGLALHGGVFLYRRAYFGECSKKDFIYTWHCNPEDSVQLLPINIEIALTFLPIIIAMLFRTMKWGNYLCCLDDN
jgi:hypothetical protein